MSRYYVIGSDRREYGPADAEEVRQWIREHRADGATQVRLEGEPRWTPLGERPEFADVLVEAGARASADDAVGSGSAVERSAAMPGAGERLAAEILARGYDLQIGDCFARGWEVLLGRFQLLAGATALVYLVFFGLWSIPTIGVGAAIVLSFVLLGGLNLLFLKALRGEPVDISVVFAGFNTALMPLLLAGTVGTSLVLVGGLLCLAPGVYLVVAWHMFAPLLVLDKGLDFWQALECSRRVVTRHWWMCGGLFLLGVLAVAAGLLACLVGAVITLPLATAAIVVAYEDIFGAGAGPSRGEVLSEPTVPGHGSDWEVGTETPAGDPGVRGAGDAAPHAAPVSKSGPGDQRHGGEVVVASPSERSAASPEAAPGGCLETGGALAEAHEVDAGKAAGAGPSVEAAAGASGSGPAPKPRQRPSAKAKRVTGSTSGTGRSRKKDQDASS